MMTITANAMKKQGISILKNTDEALITVRGKPQYVILNIKLYEKLREMELTLALNEAQKEIAAGDYHIESPAEHIKRITKK